MRYLVENLESIMVHVRNIIFEHIVLSLVLGLILFSSKKIFEFYFKESKKFHTFLTICMITGILFLFFSILTYWIPPSLTISITCFYKDKQCSNVQVNDTVSYVVRVKANGEDAGGLNVKDYATNSTLAEVKNIKLNKEGGITNDTYTIDNEGHQINWWIGNLEQDKTATLTYNVVLKGDLTCGQKVGNIAQLYIYNYSTNKNEYTDLNVETNFPIYCKNK